MNNAHVCLSIQIQKFNLQVKLYSLTWTTLTSNEKLLSCFYCSCLFCLFLLRVIYTSVGVEWVCAPPPWICARAAEQMRQVGCGTDAGRQVAGYRDNTKPVQRQSNRQRVLLGLVPVGFLGHSRRESKGIYSGRFGLL